MIDSPGARGSFRDPSGFVFRAGDGGLYRQVNRVYEAEYRRLMESGLYANLAEAGLLVPHEEVGLESRRTDDACAVLRPQRLSFISYPYEWCFSQLKDAALLTLEVQRRAMDHGMTLKDASAYNIQFAGARPLFIDTLSFETYEPGQPWVAYGQFCRHFLAPLALMAYVGAEMNALQRFHIDGIPLPLASRMLPWRSRLRPGILLHVHLHARAETRHAVAGSKCSGFSAGSAQAVPARISRQGLTGIIESLRSAVGGLKLVLRPSLWRNYYAANSYTPENRELKERIVESYLAGIAPETVWDLGANTGRYSELARKLGAKTVVAIERDPACVEVCYLAWKQAGISILPLVMDLANPSPALGWAHEERMSLAERGPADAVLALALIHHLAIGNNVPLEDTARFFRSIGKHLVIEFVCKEDPMVRQMLSSRKDVFPKYTRAGFESAFAPFFTIRDTAEAGPTRVLYRMEAR